VDRPISRKQNASRSIAISPQPQPLIFSHLKSPWCPQAADPFPLPDWVDLLQDFGRLVEFHGVAWPLLLFVVQSLSPFVRLIRTHHKKHQSRIDPNHAAKS
jgi:hypothetical protein